MTSTRFLYSIAICLSVHVALMAQHEWPVDSFYFSKQNAPYDSRSLPSLPDNLKDRTLTLRVQSFSPSNDVLAAGQWLKYELRGQSVTVFAEFTQDIFARGWIREHYYDAAQKKLELTIYLEGDAFGTIQRIQLRFGAQTQGHFFMRTDFGSQTRFEEITGTFSTGQS